MVSLREQAMRRDGVPAACGDQSVEHQRLERRAGSGESSGGFRQMTGGQQMAGCNVENDNARLRSELRCAGDG